MQLQADQERGGNCGRLRAHDAYWPLLGVAVVVAGFALKCNPVLVVVIKATSIPRALAGGVRAVHIIDGRSPHNVIAELFTDRGVGTIIRRDDAEAHP